jgi:glycosyltransferase involved in cell wall biosynthesis
MRVVHIVDDLRAVGGVQTYLAQLIPALSDRGIESVVLAGSGPSEFHGAPVVLTPGTGADGPRIPVENLRSALATAAADVTYVHIALSPSVAAAAAEFGPVVVYAHDYFMRCPGGARHLLNSNRFCSEGPGARCFVRAYTERTTNRRPDRLLRSYRRVRAWPDVWPLLHRVLVASPFVADVLTSEGLPADQVRVVPYPIPHAAAALRSAPQRDVLYIGRLTASKGVHVLLDALARMDGVTAAIAGDGPERASLERRSAALGLADRIEFLGWIGADERPELFAAARVFVMPSLWQEPFGIAGVEALAAGLSVVASDVGGVPSWLTEGDGGLLVPPGDADLLAQALERVVGDDDLRRALAARGPAAAERFSIERHLELLLPELGPT